jgi:hypothetical protein
VIGVISYLVQYPVGAVQVAKGQGLVAYANVMRGLWKHVSAENRAIVVVCLQLLT